MNNPKLQEILDAKWRLSPKGHEVIDQCQTGLWRIRTELKSYGALFRSLGDCSISGEDLLGVGNAFERLSRRIHKIEEKLSEAIENKSNV